VAVSRSDPRFNPKNLIEGENPLSNPSLLSRLTRRAALTVTAAAVAVPLAMVSPAAADTTPPSGLITTLTSPTQTNIPPTTPVTGLVNGTTVNVTVTGTGASAGKFFGAQARLCKGTSNITNQAGYNPSQTGNCIDFPFNAGSDDFQDVSAAPTNNTVTIPFRIGEGTVTIATTLAGSQTITCGTGNPCRLWLKESVDTSLLTSGIVWTHYDLQYAAAVPAPPTAVAGTPGNTTAAVTWTAPAGTVLQYEVTLTGGATPIVQTVSGATTTANFTGLTNGTAYTATVRASNERGFGTASAASAPFTPAIVVPAPGKPSGSPANLKVDLSWTAPTAGPAPTGYRVVATPVTPAGADIVRDPAGTSTTYAFTGLVNGTVYTFRVAALYGTTVGTFSVASDPITPNGKFVTQTITVTRPQGALVLTQVCSTYDRVSPPAAGLPRVQTGPAPTLGSAPGGLPDPAFTPVPGGTGYPNPTDASGNSIASYPTNCSVDLGPAKRITTGTGAGQFLQATGSLKQVSVVDERDTDQGWNLTGQMGTFVNGPVATPVDTFSGSQLGWLPLKTYTVGPTTNADGTPYVFTVNPGATVAPATVPGAGGGLQAAQTLAISPVPTGLGAGGIGTAVLDADLTVWIPVRAKAGAYTGTMTITVS